MSTNVDNPIETKIKQTEPTAHHTVLPLPSGGVFYPKEIAEIYVRRFAITDIDAMSSAKNSSDLSAMCRAIGNTITVPIEMLTQDDYQMLCYWHRVNSYPRKPLKFSWTCNNMKHIENANRMLPLDATEFEKEDLEDVKRYLKNSKTIYKTDQFDVNSMTRERFQKIVKFLKDPDRHTKGFFFIPPTVGDLIETANLAKAQIRNKRLDALEVSSENLEIVLDEITDATSEDLIIRVASNLGSVHGISLLDRMEYVREQSSLNPNLFSSDFLVDLEEFEELSDHSVTDSLVGTCGYRGCKQQTSLTVEFDLFNFFPFV